MRPGFTEFSYGFALTLEIVNALRSTHTNYTMLAPEFPSLLDEGKGKGYDVQIGSVSRPVFIQFKLSNYMKGAAAKGRKNFIYHAPYYSFKLRAHPSNQHSDLLKLERLGEEVYYAAPYFYLQRQFNAHFSSRSIFDQSIFIEPKVVMSIADGLDHEFCFDGTTNYLFSDPRPVDGGLRRSGFLNRLVESQRQFIELRDYEQVFGNILQAAGVRIDTEIARTLRGDGEDYVLASAQAARMLLGTNMLVVARVPSSGQAQ